MEHSIPSDKYLTAIHEAGHAVTAVCKGVPIELVLLTHLGPGYGWQGGVQTGDRPSGADPAQFLLAEAAMALGGLAAEAVMSAVSEPPITSDTEDDWALALAILVERDLSEAHVGRAVLWAEVHALIGVRWTQVEAVARALVEAGALRGPQVVELVTAIPLVVASEV